MFVELWMSFSISNKGGEEPSLELLKEFELKELKHRNIHEKTTQSKNNNSSASLKVYNNQYEDEDDMMENNLLGNYVSCVTPVVSLFCLFFQFKCISGNILK